MMAMEYRMFIKVLEVIDAIRNELSAGTKHFIDGKECNDPWEILRALVEKKNVTIEFHCIKCGALIKEFLPIEKRYCEKCSRDDKHEGD